MRPQASAILASQQASLAPEQGKEGRGGVPGAPPARQGSAPAGIPRIAMAHSTDAHTPRSLRSEVRSLRSPGASRQLVRRLIRKPNFVDQWWCEAGLTEIFA